MSPAVNCPGSGACATSSRIRATGFAVLCAALGAPSACADVRLPALFTDGMVLQQGTGAPVWGFADDGERVTVGYGARSATTTAHGGTWRVRLPPLEPTSEPRTLVVSGRNRIQIHDVVVGEVWIAAGQSNMQWPMSRTEHADADLSGADSAVLRLFSVAAAAAANPAADVGGRWQRAGPRNVPDFSAVAWYFARAVQHARGVPVGVILAARGSSPIEAWMNEAPPSAASPPSRLYNGMIAPLRPYAMRGVIWYQGESNADRAWQYRSLLPEMISGWRRQWGGGDFAFLVVQLPPWDRNRERSPARIAADAGGDSRWAELREAQLLSARLLPNVGLAVITDAGDKDSLHPANKRPVGERLALAARGIAYGEAVLYSGPMYRGVEFTGGRALVSFDHAGAGLGTSDGRGLRGFTVAGADRRFRAAEARIRGDRVEVGSPQVPDPVAVRYGWADYPIVNLCNSARLPASPFRTDDWPLTTQPD